MKRLTHLFLGIPLLVSFLLLATGQTTFAASHKQTASSPQQTIAWMNDQGKVTKVWTGSASAALVVEHNEMATLAKVHAEHPLANTASPNMVIPNINRVSNSQCQSDYGTVYWKLWNHQSGSAGGVCFANTGDTYIDVYDVYEITTGNNNGNFEFTDNLTGTTYNEPGDGNQYCKQLIIYPSTWDGYFDNVRKVGIVNTEGAPCEGNGSIVVGYNA